MPQAAGLQQACPGNGLLVGLTVGKAVDGVAGVMHHQHRQVDARPDRGGFEQRHQDAFARLDTPLHGGAGGFAQAKYMGKQACVLSW